MTDQCIILAGGVGKRLGKITKKIPKPLIKIKDNHFIEYVIQNFYRQGIRNFLILTWYKSEKFKLNKIKQGLKNTKIKIIKEKYKLGTAGTLRNSIKYLNESFFVTNADTFFDINIRDLEYFTNYNNSNIGVALTSSLFHKNYSSYKINKNNIVTKYQISNSKKKLVCGGIYYFKKKIIKKLKLEKLDIDRDIIKKNLNFRNKITAKIYKNSFIDIGSKATLKKAPKFIYKNIIKPCVFLDRDGVINDDLGYVHKPRQIIWRKNIFKAVKFLNDNNFRVIVVTNQAGIAKGKYKEKDLLFLTDWINKEFIKKGSFIDDTYYCPFHPKSKIKKYKKKSVLRKPNNGMIEKAFKDWKIKRNKSFIIGDKAIDIAAGKKSNIKAYYVEKDIFIQVKRILNNF
tara:strand:- start:289 stop:1485 length:1197 start_codon:yes stop_codon:yes gene_type:complete